MWYNDNRRIKYLSMQRASCYIVVFLAVTTKDSVFCASNNNNNDYDYDYNDDNDNTEEEKRIHDVIVDEWFDLIRYLVGLVLCICGLIGLYFHQFASYFFLKQYMNPKKTELRIGRVLSCEPLVRNTLGPAKNKSKNNKKKEENDKNGKKTKLSRILQVDVEQPYYQEENIERQQQQQKQKQQLIYGKHSEYRMLIVYTVPKTRSDPFLCCNANIDDDLAIRVSSSCSFHDRCSVTDSRFDHVSIAIDAYRNRSLPNDNEFNNYSNGKSSSSSNNSDSTININNYKYLIQSGDGTEYFQWFQTNKPRPIDTHVNLILLKGRPTSACTSELIESHLAQVGTAEEDDKRKYYQSVSLLGMTLLLAIIVLLVVCVFEILLMPNPETQRPIGFTILTGIVIGSMMGGYLFAKLLFEQYIKEVFLSAFVIPSTIVTTK